MQWHAECSVPRCRWTTALSTIPVRKYSRIPPRQAIPEPLDMIFAGSCTSRLRPAMPSTICPFYRRAHPLPITRILLPARHARPIFHRRYGPLWTHPPRTQRTQTVESGTSCSSGWCFILSASSGAGSSSRREMDGRFSRVIVGGWC
jgi:hypothetical protein